jgi:hypothetical protein
MILSNLKVYITLQETLLTSDKKYT